MILPDSTAAMILAFLAAVVFVVVMIAHHADGHYERQHAREWSWADLRTATYTTDQLPTYLDEYGDVHYKGVYW